MVSSSPKRHLQHSSLVCPLKFINQSDIHMSFSNLGEKLLENDGIWRETTSFPAGLNHHPSPFAPRCSIMSSLLKSSSIFGISGPHRAPLNGTRPMAGGNILKSLAPKFGSHLFTSLVLPCHLTLTWPWNMSHWSRWFTFWPYSNFQSNTLPEICASVAGQRRRRIGLDLRSFEMSVFSLHFPSRIWVLCGSIFWKPCPCFEGPRLASLKIREVINFINLCIESGRDFCPWEKCIHCCNRLL